jgi:predicted dithiol-disulfide oxidoreductase (DUF899 family)
MHDADAADARETSQSRSATDGGSALPDVVTAEEWQKARDALLVKEKRATRALDARACSAVADSVGHLAHLHARDTGFVLTSMAPLSELEPFRARMGWTVPWYSCRDRSFNNDCGIRKGFGLSAFLRDGERVFRSYFTAGRGVDRLRWDLSVLDFTVLGRQEDWEDSPAGWPQTPALYWWRLHDEYESPKQPAAAWSQGRE